MPNLREHHRADIKKWGKKIADEYKWVHEWLDSPQKVLGKEHRKFFHDQQTVEFIGQGWGIVAQAIARDHIELDKEVTDMKNAKARAEYRRKVYKREEANK